LVQAKVKAKNRRGEIPRHPNKPKKGNTMFIVIDNYNDCYREFDTLEQATQYLLEQEEKTEKGYFEMSLFEAKPLDFEIERKLVIKPQ
jgi:hypothetical protein